MRAWLPALVLGAWMLQAADWETGAGFRRRAVSPVGMKAGFTEMNNAECGVVFTNRLSEGRLFERNNLSNGGGVAVGDFDNDGRVDFFLCNKEGASGLFRNFGNWKFENVALAAGVACEKQSSTGATFADIDGDGWVDLLVTSFGGPNACFLNQRNGKFTNITDRARISFNENMTSIALADIEGDGDLDLYLNNFPLVSVSQDRVVVGMRQIGGKTVLAGRYANRLRIENNRLVEYGEPDFLFINAGGGILTNAAWMERFTDAEGKPMSAPPDFGLAVQMRDMNGDGRPDIYTCNDFHTPDRMWLNQGAGKFRAAPRMAQRNMSYAAMGVDFADIDRDGDMDFFVVEMLAADARTRLRQRAQSDPYARAAGQFEAAENVYRNTLYLNNGDGTYSEIARAAGVSATDWSWTPIFLDVDLDGYEDLLVTNGNMDDLNNLDREMAQVGQAKKRAGPLSPLLTPNAAFRNRRDLTFEKAGTDWGFDSARISHGAALGDFDNDGDLDAIVNCQNAGPLLYRNNSPAARVLVRLKGRALNTQGIGAKVTLRAGAFAQTQEIVAGGRYLSGDDPARCFASKGDETLEVRWPGGGVTTIANAQANSIYEISEPGTAEPAPGKKETKPLFADQSVKFAHRHAESVFDDFAAQPLLPRRLSQSGPALAMTEKKELVVGAARGGRIAILRGNSFQPIGPELMGDSAGLAVVAGKIVTAISPWEREAGAKAELLSIALDGGAAKRVEIPEAMTPTIVVAVGDELFVAGVSAPGKFPEAADGSIFAAMRPAPDRSAAFKNLGLATAAASGDFNSDGLMDLVVACEWGPVKIFLNGKEGFVEATEKMGLAKSNGWWMSVATGDFDGDGRMDIAGGNWGRNSGIEEFRARPLRLYHGDWMGRGMVDQIEARFVEGLKDYAPARGMETIGKALPFARAGFATHRDYSEATMAQVLKGATKASQAFLEAQVAESAVFLNRGDRFEARALPMAAQLSPAMGMVAADFDGDAKLDLFLAQNHFAARQDEERCDAGFGLLLKGDGRGNFTAVPASESGIGIYGEQRGCVAADLDGDGRLDLAVAQNGAALKVFRNESAGR